MKISKFLLIASLLLFTTHLHAQVTSSGLLGKVTDDSSKAIEGAVVKATHTPTGSIYGGVTEANGTFNIQNLRVGGPYTVEVSYGGSTTKTFNDIYLNLGENYFLNAQFKNELLSEVEIKAARDPLFNNQRTGAATTISNEQVTKLPSISRSIFDLTKLTPQSSGTSFMGRDNRYNNLQVNGANFNNLFGLSSGFPGGAQPFSLDAVDQIQVAISPYDVRQTNFTGANINVVTRSGTNNFSGSVYSFWRNETFQGKYLADYQLPTPAKSAFNTNGFRAGGAIIKNKLFFFVNAELDRNVFPDGSNQWIPSGTGVSSPTTSRTPKDSLERLSKFLRDTYGYETGAYQNYAGSYRSNNTRIMARIDYNIDKNNKVNFSYTSLDRVNDQPVNSRSSPIRSGASNSRIGVNSLAFENSNYSFTNKVKSYSAEWLSTINRHISNQLLATYTHNRDSRTPRGENFPFVDIAGLSGSSAQNALSDNYMSVGTELFSYKNDVIANTLNIYDNVTINKGIHQLTGGASLQYFSVANSFFPSGTMYYRFASLQDFISNAAPTGFGYTYAYDGQEQYIRLRYGLSGLYAQDKVTLLKNLVITAGVRVEMPFYVNKLTSNPNADTLRLMDVDGGRTQYKTGIWPEARLQISPRIAFNWTPLASKAMNVRGGTGIFAGQVPFVWFTNQPGNSGTKTNTVGITDPNILQQLRFQTDFSKYSSDIRNANFPAQSKNNVPGTLAFVGHNFRMPQVLRTDLAVDYKLPYGLVASAEVIYTKDIISVYQFNANLPNPTGVMRNLDSNAKVNNSGDSTRPFYQSNQLYTVGNLGGAYVLSNSNKGEAFSFTAGVAKSPRAGIFGSFYYTYMSAKDITSNGGAQAASVWQSTPNIYSPNQVTLAYSDFFVPHRFIGSVSYSKEYFKHFRSTLTLLYEGSGGARYSYTYNRDINNDGVINDLIYIPQSASELNFVNNQVGSVVFTAAQQRDAFQKFLDQDPYLSKHKGQYAQRNGAQLPFYHSLNMKFIQDFMTMYRKRSYTLQFSIDMNNVPNFLNRNWGVPKRVVLSQPLQAERDPVLPNNILQYRFLTTTDQNGNPVLPASTFVNSTNFGSVWNMQLGLRLIF
jgi:hypothetical protein